MMRGTSIFLALVVAVFLSPFTEAWADVTHDPQTETPDDSLKLAQNAGVADVDQKPTANIVWHVRNPFRLFEDPEDTDLHRATWLSLSGEEKWSPILAAERKLGARFSDGWASLVYKKTCWNSEKNRHSCETTNDFIHPKKHTIVASLSGVPDAETLTCVWQFTPSASKLKEFSKQREQPCHKPVEFDVPYPGGGDVRVLIGGRAVAETPVIVQDLLIVGMGDSFGSGEGNPDVPVRLSSERAAIYGVDKPGMTYSLAGFPARVGPWRDIGDKAFIAEDARWHDKACHRSLYSHQLRAALQISIEEPHRAVTFVGLACSGAEVTQGLFLRYKGHDWVPTPPDLSQISAAAVAQCGAHKAPVRDYPEAYHMRKRVPELENILVLNKCTRKKARKIDLLFLSIGGNDIGFARLVANAVLSDKSLLKRIGGWAGQVFRKAQADAKIRALKHRYKALKRAFHNVLHMPWKESDRVVLTAYPGMAFLRDGKRVCPDGRAGMEVVPAYALSEHRVKEAVAVAEKLNGQMRRHAKSYGWSFAEAHRPAFNGRGVCAGDTKETTATEDNLLLPRKVDGNWVPYNPAHYRAYAPRQRWFRTPNDAFMIGNFHVSQKRLPEALRFNALGLFQLVLASTYSGAFHPSAEGQAAIADAVADRARDVLKKYGQGGRSTFSDMRAVRQP